VGDLKDYIDSLLMMYHDCVDMDCVLIWKLSSSYYCVDMPICIGSETLC